MYKIAKLKFCIRNLTGNQSAARLVPFLYQGNDPDLTYEIRYTDDLIAVCKGKEIACSASVRVFEYGNSLICAYLLNGQVYAVREESGDTVILHLYESQRNEIWHEYFLPDLLHLERPLIRRDCFVLHSSYIATEHGAILFTAPSGGGKTTQAQLWVDHKNARIINGDKTAVCLDAGCWFACGLPISGSSPYWLNENHPLRAIVILEKAPENRLYRVDVRGFSRILSQTIMNTWDSDYCAMAMDLVSRACCEVPVYLYQCTKEPDAADVLYQTLFGKEDSYGLE